MLHLGVLSGAWPLAQLHLRRDVSRGSISTAAALDAYNTTIADLLNTNRGLASGIAGEAER